MLESDWTYLPAAASLTQDLVEVVSDFADSLVALNRQRRQRPLTHLRTSELVLRPDCVQALRALHRIKIKEGISLWQPLNPIHTRTLTQTANA